MNNRIKSYIKSVPKHFWILGVIILVGLFLRTYNFTDWMIFNPDQARDAILVQNMLDGKEFPLLGPQAGNTRFKLGPIFYYFEFVSAKIFGKEAASMAYPDLFFSLLSLPLMFFFALKFFQKNIALAVSALYALSYFMVYYSRFAFNPNSIPFFTLLFLYGLSEIIDSQRKEKYLWAAMVGIAMGVGFQLHALLFVTMPIVATLVFAYMFYKRNFIWKSALVVLLFFLIANTGQLISEFKLGAANTRAFFSGAGSESTDGNLVRNISYDFVCHIQGNTYVATSLGTGDKCDIMKIVSRVQKKGFAANAQRVFAATVGIIFFIGGLILLGFKIKKEKNKKTKNMFILASVYILVMFLVFIPVSSSISIRYYIAEAFLPFLMFGLWLEFILQTSNRKYKLAAIFCFVGFFAASNLESLYQTAIANQKGLGSNVDNGIYKDVAAMSEYMMQSSQGTNEIYLAGKRKFLSRYGEPLQYFAKQSGVSLNKVSDSKKIKAGTPLFYVTKKKSKKDSLPILMKNHDSLEVKNFGNISITKIAN